MSDTTKNYQYFAGEKNGEVVYGHCEGWTFAKKDDVVDGKPTKPLVTLGTVTKNGNEVTYANMTIAMAVNPNTIKFLFGEEFIPSDGKNLIIRVTAWGKIAENLAKYNPSLQQVIGFTGKFTINEYNGKKSIQMSASNFKVVTKKKPELAFDGQVEVTTSEEITEVPLDSELPF